VRLGRAAGRRRGVGLGMLAASVSFVVGLAACGNGVTPSATVTATGSSAPSSSVTGSPSSTAGASSSAGVVVDASLLAHLPASVGGVPMTEDAATAAQVAADPGLGQAATAIAMSLAISASDTSEDLAIASVIKLRPGVFSGPFYAEWRTAYDDAACGQAGGVAGSSEQLIGAYHAFIGSCTGGARTYHVQLPDDILVSVTAAGTRDFGALVVAGLR
jgi:hypothetical protein